MQDFNRLRRKALEGSALLLSWARDDPAPMSGVIREVAQGNTKFAINGTSELLAVEERLDALTANLASTMSLRILGPVLVGSVGRVYFEEEESYPYWLGLGLKSALARLWRSGPLAGSDSLKSLQALVAASSLTEELRGVRLAFTLSGEGRVAIGGRGWVADPQVTSAIAALSAAHMARGAGLRAASTARTLVRHPVAALRGLDAVLNGADPAAAPEFAGTLLAGLPREEEGSSFWLGLRNRIQVLGALAHSSANQAVSFIRMSERWIEMAWSDQWRQRATPWMLPRLISERPLFPIGNGWAASSAGLVADSITWHIESWLFGHRIDPEERLSERAKKLAVTEPFERETQELFASLGLASGGVTENGTWHALGRAPFLLVHERGEECPGEIDVLAVHEGLNLVVLGECKVLSLPVSDATFRNMLSKVGSEDSEAFYSKLRAKLRWLRGTHVFRSVHESQFVSLVIVDRPSPGLPLKNDAMAVAFEDVREVLGELLERPHLYTRAFHREVSPIGVLRRSAA